MADPFQKPRTNQASDDMDVIALQVLAWVIQDDNRSQRLLDMTGLTVDDLRARAGSTEVLAAVMGWLAAHEPDLLTAADDLSIAPERLTQTIHDFHA